jgi:hypothetical protein
VSKERPPVTRADVSAAISEIRAYHAQGVQSLRELPVKGAYGAGAIDEQAGRLSWNPTKLRKARQFAHPESGYSGERLKELFRLLREHRPVFGVTHIGLLVSVPWPQRAELQSECITGGWSTYELQARIKRLFGTRREGGRRRRVSGDPAGALVQLREMADTWERWFRVAEEEGEGGLPVLDGLPEKVRARAVAARRAVKLLFDAIDDELE